MEKSVKGLSAEVAASYMKLTDAAIRAATLPSGKSQHYLHDTEQPGLAIVAPFQQVVRIAPPLLKRSGRAPDDRGRL